MTERGVRTVGRFYYEEPFMFDTVISGRLYTRGRMSPDSGGTWVPLFPFKPGDNVGGGKLLAVGPDSRVLMVVAGETMLQEYSNGRWQSVSTDPPDVHDAAYLPDGTLVAVNNKGVAFVGGRELGLPGDFRITNVLVTSTGTVLAISATESVGEQPPFAIYRLNGKKDTWLPIGGAGRVRQVATGPRGRIYVLPAEPTSEALGSYEDGEWHWMALPSKATRFVLAAHPRSDLVVLFGGSSLVRLCQIRRRIPECFREW
jgi:hypothetical protein